ncbi:hypothetical protein [Zhongshania aliphaticivorans]|uniref:hypothetical protein n=1 Tax=Zhongshania aliphaticivorans TaxID=1470434 RepID=UPI0039C99B12
MNKNILIIIMAAFSLPATAEQKEYKPTSKLEEVVVTAQRRVQDVRDVPIAITVLAGADMRDKAISDLTDMAHLLPNVSINTDYNAWYRHGRAECDRRAGGSLHPRRCLCA